MLIFCTCCHRSIFKLLFMSMLFLYGLCFNKLFKKKYHITCFYVLQIHVYLHVKFTIRNLLTHYCFLVFFSSGVSRPWLRDGQKGSQLMTLYFSKEATFLGALVAWREIIVPKDRFWGEKEESWNGHVTNFLNVVRFQEQHYNYVLTNMSNGSLTWRIWPFCFKSGQKYVRGDSPRLSHF